MSAIIINSFNFLSFKLISCSKATRSLEKPIIFVLFAIIMIIVEFINANKVIESNLVDKSSTSTSYTRANLYNYKQSNNTSNKYSNKTVNLYEYANKLTESTNYLNNFKSSLRNSNSNNNNNINSNLNILSNSILNDAFNLNFSNITFDYEDKLEIEANLNKDLLRPEFRFFNFIIELRDGSKGNSINSTKLGINEVLSLDRDKQIFFIINTTEEILKNGISMSDRNHFIKFFSITPIADHHSVLLLLKMLSQVSPSNRIINEISIYVTTLICLIGIVGNVLSLKVFCSTKLPRTSSRTYLIALTITDGVFLVSHFIDTTCKEIYEHFKLDFPINITDQKQTMCRAFALLRATCKCASPWIIVAFTLERFLVVHFPHHSNLISKPLLAKRLIYFIMTVSVLISLYAPILSGVTQKQFKKITDSPYADLINTYNQQKYVKKTCDVLTEYRSIYLYITLFYTIIVIILPILIVSVLNALLIVRLYKSTDEWTSAKLEIHEQEMSYKEIRDKKCQIENLKITWTLIIISLTFIFLTLPYVIVYFISSIVVINNRNKVRPLMLPNKIFELFYIFNHSINFFLYVVTRNSFRRVLKEKLKCDCLNFKKYMIVNDNNPNPNNMNFFINRISFKKYSLTTTSNNQYLNNYSSSNGPKSPSDLNSNNNTSNSYKLDDIFETNKQMLPTQKMHLVNTNNLIKNNNVYLQSQTVPLSASLTVDASNEDPSSGSINLNTKFKNKKKQSQKQAESSLKLVMLKKK